jgi:mono/diheme cytochrome c family protein
MRQGRLGLIGTALAAAVVAAGCDRTPGSNERADGQTDARAQWDSTARAPNVGVSGGTVAGADTAAAGDTGSRSGAAPTPPLNARPDSSAPTPQRKPEPSGPVPPSQASRSDTAGTTRSPTTATRSPDTATRGAGRAAAPAPTQPRAGSSGDSAGRSPDTTAAQPDVATRTPKSAATPSKTVTQVEYTGWKQYEVNCARCHGEYGLGSTIAPSLYHSFQSGAVDSAEYQRVVHGSRTAKGMPNWTGMLSEEYLHAIYKYLEGRGAGRIAAGRPTPQG